MISLIIVDIYCQVSFFSHEELTLEFGRARTDIIQKRLSWTNILSYSVSSSFMMKKKVCYVDTRSKIKPKIPFQE
jgi:hypothetical protein